MRALRDAPAPNAGTVHSVTNSVSFLDSMMMNGNTTQNTPNQHTVLAPTVAHLKSGASLANVSTRNPRRPRLARKRKKRRTRMTSQRRTHAHTARNTSARSPIASNRIKCMWNKKYKGYRFKLICNELKVDFKPRHKFPVDLGGYAEKEGLQSK